MRQPIRLIENFNHILLEIDMGWIRKKNEEFMKKYKERYGDDKK